MCVVLSSALVGQSKQLDMDRYLLLRRNLLWQNIHFRLRLLEHSLSGKGLWLWFQDNGVKKRSKTRCKKCPDEEFLLICHLGLLVTELNEFSLFVDSFIYSVVMPYVFCTC